MKQLGVNVKPMKFKYGNQFQDWAKINIPVIDSIFGIPDLVVNETVMFLPPMSNNPTLKMAPILAMISTWVLAIIYSTFFLKSANFGSEFVVLTWNKIANDT